MILYVHRICCKSNGESYVKVRAVEVEEQNTRYKSVQPEAFPGGKTLWKKDMLDRLSTSVYGVCCMVSETARPKQFAQLVVDAKRRQVAECQAEYEKRLRALREDVEKAERALQNGWMELEPVDDD